MNEVQRRTRAASLIQSTFRSYQERMKCMEILQSRHSMDDRAARQIQFCVRTILDRTRERKAELKRLEQRQKFGLRRGKRHSILNDKEKDRLNVLRQQFRKYNNNPIDRRLLMRPNTKFQVI